MLVVIVFCDDDHFFSYEVGGVEAHTKLTDHGDVSSSLKEKSCKN